MHRPIPSPHHGEKITQKLTTTQLILPHILFPPLSGFKTLRLGKKKRVNELEIKVAEIF